MSDTKTCSKCKTEKTVDNFVKNKTTKDGLAGHCKQCIKEHRNRPEIRERRIEWARKHRERWGI